MKCWSRSTLGVIIGIINVLCNIGIAIFLIVLLVKINTIKGEQKEQQMKNEDDIAFQRTMFSVLIVVCFIMTFISGLLIMGIVKRRHKLMLPWVFLSWLGFIFNCGSFIVKFFAALFSGASLGVIFTLLFVGVIGFGISAKILWTIYTLYRDIRQENIGKPGPEIRRSDLENNSKTVI